MTTDNLPLSIGWAAADLTPDRAVEICGQFHTRVSEGVADPITATVMAVSSGEGDPSAAAVLVSCDLVCISDSLRDAIRRAVSSRLPRLDPQCILLNATHTHTAPEVRLPEDRQRLGGGMSTSGMCLDLPTMDPAEYIAFAAGRIAEAVEAAWNGRRPGSIGFGLGHAVIGRNRRSAYYSGESRMYGKTGAADFSHVEGYEDHSVNVLGAWDPDGRLTGLVVNVPCPSQVSESDYQLSADYWCETRAELRRRFGEGLFVLPQCSAAGDQSPHVQWGKPAEERMRRLAGRTQREELATRIADAVSALLPLIETERAASLPLAHRVETVELSRRMLSQADVDDALAEAAQLRAQYETLRRDLDANPQKRHEPRWYVPLTAAYRRMKWCEGVRTRHEMERTQPKLPVEVHVLRLGDVAIATNPFEYYLDFGIQIKARSPAVQTFVVQLAGPGTYVPTARATAGRSYGAIPASTPIGPEGGRELVDWTVAAIEGLWGR